MAASSPTPQDLQNLRDFTAQWGKIIARRAFGDDGPTLDLDLFTFEQVAQADQATEDLIGGFEADHRLRGAVAGGATGAQSVHDGGPRRLDRFAGGTAVDAGMCLPGSVDHRGWTSVC